VEDLTVVLSARDFVSASDLDAVLLMIRASAARAAIGLSEVSVISVANADGVECVRYENDRCRSLASFAAAELGVGLVYVTFGLRRGGIATVVVDVSVDALVAEKLRERE